MSTDERRLSLARFLLEAGAGHSACNVLGALRGVHANRLRLAAHDARLRPGIYCLVALPDATGAVLPLRPVPGYPRASDPAFRQACIVAHEQARRVLDDRALPALRFEFEEELSIFGPSIGLPAALAFLAYFARERAPARPVLATGGLLPDGRVTAVGHLETKSAIAEREDGAALIIFPTGCAARPEVAHTGTITEAVRLVFGAAPLELDTSFSAVDTLAHRARTAADASQGIALLESLDRGTLTAADRLRVLFDLGTLQRNLGQSRAAFELHAEARILLDAERLVIGSEVAERYELECWATALDQFRLDETVRELEARLSLPFLKFRNELRCRGMLAQGLAMGGHFSAAVRVRSENLALHERSQALGKVLPATLCHLALDAALARDPATFERHAWALCAATRAGDEAQCRFNASVIVRGLVALGRYDDAIRWAFDRTSAFGARPSATLVAITHGAASAIAAPEPSAVRALVRALRRLGRGEDAIELATRTLQAGRKLSDLFGWLLELVRLELALAQRDCARAETAEQELCTAWQRLTSFHPEATRAHPGLLHSSTQDLEHELDRVWY